MPDIEKWKSPATSGEVTRALLEIRTAMIGLYGMLHGLRLGNADAIGDSAKSYLEADANLSKLLDEIGGLK